MANKAEGGTTTPMPYPPEIYYKQYTNQNIRKGIAPQPPKIPLGAVSVFGQPQVENGHIINHLIHNGLSN